MVRSLVALGKTVWLTTHFMDEAQYLADRVAVIASGRIVAEGPPESLAGRDHMRSAIRFRPAAGAPAPPDWGQLPAGDGAYVLEANDVTRAVHDLTAWALEGGFGLDLLEVTQPTLEDVYLELTGGEEGAE
jgi:ABC-2 type transport system ATP-binding protein